MEIPVKLCLVAKNLQPYPLVNNNFCYVFTHNCIDKI